MTLKLIFTVLNIFHFGAGGYASEFHTNGRRYEIAPLLIAAVAANESQFKKNVVSRTNDHGLMQLHVGKRTHEKYIGREHLLLQPKRNIRLGSRMLYYWRAYHERNCKMKKHHWLLHYNQGGRVYTSGWKGGYAKRVLKIYEQLIKIKMKILLRTSDATS